MAITTLKVLRLKNASLVDLFARDEAHWKALAQRAKQYVSEFVPANEIHPDDLIPFLVPRLELDAKVREKIESKRLAQNRITWFSEYVVDRVWDEI